MSRARNPRSVAIELPHRGAARSSGTCDWTYPRIRSSACVSETVDARTAVVSPDRWCMTRTTSTMPSRIASSALMITSTPSSSIFNSGSVTIAATSINLSCPRSRPVISQSIQTILSLRSVMAVTLEVGQDRRTRPAGSQLFSPV